MPGDGKGAYKTHQYRDLFAELGNSPAESRGKIAKAFQQLFRNYFDATQIVSPDGSIPPFRIRLMAQR